MAEAERDDPAEGEKYDAAIIKLAHERFKADVDRESDERALMLDDQNFAALDQWPEAVRAARENPNQPGGARPCLTSDTFNQYKVQVVNDMRQNRPAVKIRPVDSGADVGTAKIFQGIDRHIEDRSNSEIAYLTAGESVTICGLGYFRILTEYSDPLKFNEQEIFIRAIPKTLSVYMGPHIEPDGSDTDHCFITEDMPVEEFKSKYPGKDPKPANLDATGDIYWNPATDVVRIAEYYYIEHKKQTLLLLDDGRSMLKGDYEKLSEGKIGIKDSRETEIKCVKWCKIYGGEELLETADVVGEFIPVVEVIGNCAWINGKRHLWGMVRAAKDMLRMLNYFLSAATERMALAPRAPFIAAAGQIEGREKEWENANTENRAVLQYNAVDINGNAVPAPRRQDPPQTDMATAQMLNQIEHRVQAALGMHKASLGDESNEKSGRAILARQKEGDTATFHYPDNLSKSVRHGGRIRIGMIPKIYDTAGIARMLGDDGTTSHAQLDPKQPQAKLDFPQSDGSIKSIYNLGVGKYDVTISVGPSYSTKRMEAAEAFTQMASSAHDPASAAVLHYLTVKYADFAASDEATTMLKALLPPQVLQAVADGEHGPVPPQVAAALQKAAIEGAQMKQVIQQLGQENQQLKSGVAEGMAKVEADRQEGLAKQQLLEAEAKADYDLRAKKQKDDSALAHAKALDEHNLKKWVAEREVEIDQFKAREAKRLQDEKINSDRAAVDKVSEGELSSGVMPQFLEALNGVNQSLAQQAQLMTVLTERLPVDRKILKDAHGNVLGGSLKFADGTEQRIQ